MVSPVWVSANVRNYSSTQSHDTEVVLPGGLCMLLPVRCSDLVSTEIPAPPPSHDISTTPRERPRKQTLNPAQSGSSMPNPAHETHQYSDAPRICSKWTVYNLGSRPTTLASPLSWPERMESHRGPRSKLQQRFLSPPPFSEAVTS